MSINVDIAADGVVHDVDDVQTVNDWSECDENGEDHDNDDDGFG